MCDPTGGVATMAALTVASTGLKVMGGVQTSKANQAAYQHASEIAQFNAAQAERGSKDAMDRGEEEAVAHGREVAALRGTQEATWGSSGVEMGYGSTADVATDTDLLAAEDAARIRQNAQRESRGYSISAENYRQEARGAQMSKSAERKSMYINAASTLVSGASQLAGMKYKYGS